MILNDDEEDVPALEETRAEEAPKEEEGEGEMEEVD